MMSRLPSKPWTRSRHEKESTTQMHAAEFYTVENTVESKGIQDRVFHTTNSIEYGIEGQYLEKCMKYSKDDRIQYPRKYIVSSAQHALSEKRTK